MRIRLFDEIDVPHYTDLDEMPDVEYVPRRTYRGRCPECWQSMGCAPSCPNEDFELED